MQGATIAAPFSAGRESAASCLQTSDGGWTCRRRARLRARHGRLPARSTRGYGSRAFTESHRSQPRRRTGPRWSRRADDTRAIVPKTTDVSASLGGNAAGVVGSTHEVRTSLLDGRRRVTATAPHTGLSDPALQRGAMPDFSAADRADNRIATSRIDIGGSRVSAHGMPSHRSTERQLSIPRRHLRTDGYAKATRCYEVIARAAPSGRRRS